MSNSILVGADIGGSHISASLVDLQSMTALKDAHVRVHVNSHGTVDEIINAWAEAIEKLFSTHKIAVKRVGVAMPNPVDYESGISFIKGIDKYDALYGLNIKELLSKRLGIKPTDIRMKNDAGCFLQGEALGGAAKGYKDAIGLTIGTGIGTARYHKNIAEDADLWHASFRDGMTEDYISSRWFVKRYFELSGNPVNNVKELAALYKLDKNAQAVFTEFADNLAEFLVSFVELDNPEVIVIGGNISNASALFFPALENRLKEHAIEIPIHRAELGEEAAIIGAASCWLEKKNSSTILSS